MAAEYAGNLIHTVNPDILIIVQGIHFGNDLQGAKLNPVELLIPHKVVYSAHVYDTHSHNFDLSDY
jgi:endoglucanase